MKPGIAILPLEVWADTFEHPLLTRQMLAQIADNNGDWNFTEKLQRLLHGCGKHSLRYLDISAKRSDKTTEEPKIEPECRALLAVAPDFDAWKSYVHMRDELSSFKECEFPECEMPANIKTFKLLSIRHLDDEVLAFLEKIKPLFTNVCLVLHLIQSVPNDMQIVFTHLRPMLGSIRGIYCTNECLELLEQHFQGTLALTNELYVFNPKLASIPACLNWLSAPLDFDLDGPKSMKAYGEAKTIFAILEAVRNQFLTATTPSAFVICLEFIPHRRADENTFENAATREELSIRNAQFKKADETIIHYVEVLRHPTGAEAKMREWIGEEQYNSKESEAYKVIWIRYPTIGHITKQAEADSANVRDNTAEGSSTLAEEK